MDATKTPGAAEERLCFRGRVILVEPTLPAAQIDFAFDGGTQEIEHARHSNEQGRAFAFDGAENFAGIGGVFENYRGAEKRWNEKSHELSEDVAQRNQRNEAQRMEQTLVFEIGLHAAFYGFEVGKKISVREDDAARFGRSAGGEEDFRDLLASERFGGRGLIDCFGCFTGNSLRDENTMLGHNVG